MSVLYTGHSFTVETIDIWNIYSKPKMLPQEQLDQN